MQDNGANFTYILRSAADWSGPVVHETVRVKAEKGLDIKAIVAQDGKLKAKEQQGELVWELKNAVPTEDINVDIVTAATGKRAETEARKREMKEKAEWEARQQAGGRRRRRPNWTPGRAEEIDADIATTAGNEPVRQVLK